MIRSVEPCQSYRSILPPNIRDTRTQERNRRRGADKGTRRRESLISFSEGDLQIPDEPDDHLTGASLDALAAALSVRWPEWYRTFALELAAQPKEPRPFWLPGGFIFASPRRAFEETTAFRRGERFFSGAPSIDEAGAQWPARPLPDRYVVVGRTGEGPVIVDTPTDAPMLLWLDKEGYWREPLIDFTALGKTPVEVARAIVRGATGRLERAKSHPPQTEAGGRPAPGDHRI